jgi:predicted DCC family thiol-disulfide oxidoreductase YuxK
MSARVGYPLTVYYDASCPMCAGEMHSLKDLDAHGRIVLVDCSAPGFRDDALQADGISREAPMRLIHARDANGRWLIGIDCFEAVYRAAGLGRAARVWGSPRLRRALVAIYPWIARHRQLLSRLGINAAIRYLIPKPQSPGTCHGTSCKTGL